MQFLGERAGGLQVVHALDFYKQGEGDDRVWVSMVKEKHWLPITADRGKSNSGEKLPKILKELGVIHISLSAAVNRLPAKDKTAAIAACWPEIVNIWRSQVGFCHRQCLSADQRDFFLLDVEAKQKSKTR